MTYVQEATNDYVNKFCLLSLEDTFKLKEELMTRFKLPEKTAIQIVNLFTTPTIPLELNIILDKQPVTLTEEEKNDLLSVLRGYAEKYQTPKEEPEPPKEEI